MLADGFEAIDPTRWSITGKPATADQPRLGEGRSLRLPAEGASLTHNLEEPLAAGRLELAFHDDGAIVPRARVRRRARVPRPDGAGRDADHPGLVRGEPGRRVARRAVAASPAPGPHAGLAPPGAAVRARARPRSPLTARNWPTAGSPEGPLCAIRLATRTTDAAAPARPPSAYFDDLRLIRFAEPPASLEIDASQDEARLVVGDQIFGEVRGADAERVVDGGRRPADRAAMGRGRRAVLPPGAGQGIPIEGLLVRAEWRSAPGDRPTDLDFAEGALLAVSDDSLTLATPYAGTLTIPRGPICRLAVLGRGRRHRHRRRGAPPGRRDLRDPARSTRPSPKGLTLDRTVELAARARRSGRAGARRRRGRAARPAIREYSDPGPQRRAPHLRRRQRQAGRLPQSPHQDGGTRRPSGSGSRSPAGCSAPARTRCGSS